MSWGLEKAKEPEGIGIERTESGGINRRSLSSKPQVRSALGQPVKVVDLGKKQIYVYKDLKVTFADGKVTDVQ
jgi:hypothetical protein